MDCSLTIKIQLRVLAQYKTDIWVSLFEFENDHSVYYGNKVARSRKISQNNYKKHIIEDFRIYIKHWILSASLFSYCTDSGSTGVGNNHRTKRSKSLVYYYTNKGKQQNVSQLWIQLLYTFIWQDDCYWYLLLWLVILCTITV